MVWRLLPNNWYSILVNGKSYGYFSSSRGLKQGNSLSLTLFIIVAEVLSRSLKKLLEDQSYIGFGMTKQSERRKYLSYIGDTILFSSGQKGSIKNMMNVLVSYEKVSGQFVNSSKGFLYIHNKVTVAVRNRIRRITGIAKVLSIHITGMSYFL